MMAAALDAARRGWPVFPLVQGEKRPAVTAWETRATRDLRHVASAWGGRYSGFNIGVAAGPAGLVVVDLDTSEDLTEQSGAENLDELCRREHLTLPPTFTVDTPSGGRHLYFSAPAGSDLRNTAGRLAPKIDTRAGGGYVVAAGSRTVAGLYRIALDAPVAALPPPVLQLLLPVPSPPPPPPVRLPSRNRADRYVLAVVERECDAVKNATSLRNHRLYIAAVNLGQFVAGGALLEHPVRAALTSAASVHVGSEPSWTAAAAAKTITSGLTAGAKRPRTIHP